MSVSFQNPLTRRLPSPSTTQDARSSAIPPNAPDTPAALNAVLELTSTPAPQEPTAPRKPSVPTVMACFLLGMNTAQLHHDERTAKSLSQPRRNWMPSATMATKSTRNFMLHSPPQEPHLSNFSPAHKAGNPGYHTLSQVQDRPGPEELFIALPPFHRGKTYPIPPIPQSATWRCVSS